VTPPPSGALRGPRSVSAPKAAPGAVGRRASSPEEKERRRQDILAAAKQVFAERGYHATTMADVARAAGLSYGSVYWYFESKEVLFHALMASEERALRRHLARTLAAAPEDPPDAAFRAAVRATFEFFEADRDAVKLLLRDATALGDPFEQHLFGINEGFVDDIAAVVTEAQQRGVVIDAPPRVVAFSIAALVGQLACRRLVTDDGLTAGQLADFAVHLLLQGLVPRHRLAPVVRTGQD
jgi:AcrR family transcriptional regulator